MAPPRFVSSQRQLVFPIEIALTKVRNSLGTLEYAVPKLAGQWYPSCCEEVSRQHHPTLNKQAHETISEIPCSHRCA